MWPKAKPGAVCASALLLQFIDRHVFVSFEKEPFAQVCTCKVLETVNGVFSACMHLLKRVINPDGDALQREWKPSQKWKTAASRGWQPGNLSLHRPPTGGGGGNKNESTAADDGNPNLFPILLSGFHPFWDLSLPLSALLPDRYYCTCC